MGSAKPAYLYVIGDGSGAHKVGLSAQPRRRLSQLQVGSSRRLILVRTSERPLDEPDAVEDYAHWLLREAREHGEWFNVTAEAAWVALVAAAEAVERGEYAPSRTPPDPRIWAYWQARMKRAGLTQAELARLAGKRENAISEGLRGKGKGGVPIYLRTIIRLWEVANRQEREAILKNPETGADD